MNEMSRRDLLKTLFGGAVAAVGTVVVARATLAADGPDAAPAAEDVQARADRLAGDAPAESDTLELANFLNGAFRNGGGFRNGGFVNGGFRNGGFRNGGWVNGGFRNGGFRNGAFRNW